MSLDDKLIKLSVSEIVYTLLPSNYRGNFSAYHRGNTLHYKLGYMNTQRFVRYLVWDGTVIQVSGVPDKIDYEQKAIRELKTSRDGLSEEQLLKAKMQLYLYTWLTGMEKGYLDVYSLKDETLREAVVEVKRNDEIAEEIIKDYVGLRRLTAMARRFIIEEKYKQLMES